MLEGFWPTYEQTSDPEHRAAFDFLLSLKLLPYWSFDPPIESIWATLGMIPSQLRVLSAAA
jgi:hypothetical protein